MRAIRLERLGSPLLLKGAFFSESLRERIVGRYSSGQRGLTVNQVASPSQVRILACPPLRTHPSGRSSGVELQPSKLAVTSSNLVARSTPRLMSAHVAQLAEHVLGKDEVTRSIRVVGSKQNLFDQESLEIWDDWIKLQVHYASHV